LSFCYRNSPILVFMQVGGRRDGKPYGICQNRNSCVQFQNFEPHLHMVNQLFSNFVQLRKCGKSSYLSSPKIHLCFEVFMQKLRINLRERVWNFLNFECFLNFIHDFWMEDLFITFIRKSVVFIMFSLSFLFSIIINIIYSMLVYFVYGIQRFCF
jgi:hypothetical protein